MADIFREVDEDLRRDRLEKLWQRHGNTLIGVAVLIVVATAAFVVWQRWHHGKLEERTGLLVEAVRPLEPADGGSPDRKAAIAALDAAAAKLDGAPATLASLHRAGLLAREGQTADAIALYDRIAGTSGTDVLIRDFALLMSVTHQADTGDAAQLQGRLAPLLLVGNAWRFSARELSGILHARAGETAQAAARFKELADDAETPPGIRARATELAALYAAPKQ